MNIAIVTVAYTHPDTLPRLFQSARSRRHSVRFYLFLHSRVPKVVAACDTAQRLYPVVYHPYGTNRGLARSWNEGLLEAYGDGADVALITNDDIEFGEGDVDRLADYALEHRDYYLAGCAGYNVLQNQPVETHGYACCAINPIALERLGCFDENFSPAYFEDSDYIRRSIIAGLGSASCPDTQVRHMGSASCFQTHETAEQAAAFHRANEEYFRRKWGVEGEITAWQENAAFIHPFNEPAFDCHIASDKRRAPYGPGYDRTDLAGK